MKTKTALIALLVLCGNCAQTQEVIPFHLVGEHIIIKVHIGDHAEALDFIFDTGASSIVLNETTAERLGIQPIEVSSLSGANGEIAVKTIRGKELHVGGMTLRDATMYATSVLNIEESLAHRIDGVIGAHLIKKFVTEINYDEAVLIFSNSEMYEPWPDAYELDIDATMPLPTTRVSLMLGDEEYDCEFVIDSGSGLPIAVNSPAVDQYNLIRKLPTLTTEIAGLSEGKSEAHITRIPEIQLGKYSFKNVISLLSQAKSGATSFVNFEGIIGNPILRKFNMTLDYSRNKMYLSENKSFNEPFRDNWVGFGVKYDFVSGKMIIEEVLVPEKIDDAIKEGVAIRSVDGVEVNFENYHSIKTAMYQGGDPLKVVVESEGIFKEIELERKLFF